MSLTASASAKGSNFAPIEPGTYTAVCYMLCDLGVQETTWQGKKKTSQKVIIGWQIPEETYEFDGKVLPRTISKRYTMSLDERASLRADLAAWRGRDFTPEELEGFNLRNIVGTSCLIQINNSENDGKTYANVQSIVRLPKGMPAAAMVGDPVIYDIDDSPLEELEKLPDWIKETIKKSSSYEERLVAESVKTQEFKELADGDGDGELPF